MKLILTADVDHLGSAGETVEVKDGYGRNFLLPRGLAIVASRGAQKQADDIRRARDTKQVRDLEHANEIKAALEGLGSVPLAVKTAGDSGKLFGSVTTERRRHGHPQGRRPQPRQARGAFAQEPHQGRWQPPDHFARPPRRRRRTSRSTSSPRAERTNR